MSNHLGRNQIVALRTLLSSFKHWIIFPYIAKLIIWISLCHPINVFNTKLPRISGLPFPSCLKWNYIIFSAHDYSQWWRKFNSGGHHLFIAVLHGGVRKWICKYCGVMSVPQKSFHDTIVLKTLFEHYLNICYGWEIEVGEWISSIY